MSRNLEPKGKIVRRLGVNIFGNPKYDRLLERRPNPPGMVHRRRKQTSDYAKQLLEKQKIRFAYGLGERQFRNLFEKANAMKGVTGDNMLQLLERRLDNVVYRIGMASTAQQARQLVNHNHIRVNGEKVTIASYTVNAGDVITANPRQSSRKLVERMVSETVGRPAPVWLSLDKVKTQGTVVRLPEKTDFSDIFNPQMVVEFYSK
jgi:small subunit ribosomal protein S4